MSTPTETDERMDQLLRHASRRLHGHLQLPVNTLTQKSNPGLGRRRIGFVAATVLGVVGVIGFIAVRTRNNEITPAASSDVGPRWVVTDLPDGWSIVDTVGPGGAPYVDPAVTTIYGTTSAPLGPLLQISSSPDPTGDPTRPDISTEIRSGRETLSGTAAGGKRILYVRTPNGWTVLTAVELDDATLTGLVDAVTLNESGVASISPDRLPTGMRLIVSDTLLAIAPIVADAQSNDPGLGTRSDYDRPPASDGPGMSLYTAPATPTELLWMRLNTTSFGEIQLESGSGQLVTGVTGENFRSLYWQHDGIAFLLSSPTFNDLQLVAAANSARPADLSVWAQLGGDQVVPPGDTIPATVITGG